jgi:hypothetical protein
VRDPLPRVSAFERNLPASLDGSFERALARSPDERFGSAKELAIEQRALPAQSKAQRLPPWSFAFLVLAVGASLMAATLKRAETLPHRAHRAASAAFRGKLHDGRHGNVLLRRSIGWPWHRDASTMAALACVE